MAQEMAAHRSEDRDRRHDEGSVARARPGHAFDVAQLVEGVPEHAQQAEPQQLPGRWPARPCGPREGADRDRGEQEPDGVEGQRREDLERCLDDDVVDPPDQRHQDEQAVGTRQPGGGSGPGVRPGGRKSGRRRSAH